MVADVRCDSDTLSTESNNNPAARYVSERIAALRRGFLRLAWN